MHDVANFCDMVYRVVTRSLMMPNAACDFRLPSEVELIDWEGKGGEGAEGPCSSRHIGKLHMARFET